MATNKLNRVFFGADMREIRFRAWDDISKLMRYNVRMSRSAEWFKDKFPDRWERIKNRRGAEFKITNLELREFYERAKKCKDWQEYDFTFRATLKILKTHI